MIFRKLQVGLSIKINNRKVLSKTKYFKEIIKGAIFAIWNQLNKTSINILDIWVGNSTVKLMIRKKNLTVKGIILYNLEVEQLIFY